jgi:hypothetical protein
MKQDYELILLAASRYALGRKTYIVSAVVDYLEKEWNSLSDNFVYSITVLQ